MPARNAKLDEYVGMRRRLPVGRATFNAEGDANNNGIDWIDYDRMGYTQHKLNKGRRLETPAWVMNDNSLRAVIVRFVELRAGFKAAQPGTSAERLKRAEARIAASLPSKDAHLTRLCKEFVDLKRAGGDAEYIRKFAEEIENLDTVLCTTRNVAGIALRLATLYWKQGYHSAECAAELHLKPPHCRMMLMRLCRVAARLGLGAAPVDHSSRKPKKLFCSRCGAARQLGSGECPVCGLRCSGVSAGHRIRMAAKLASLTPSTPKRQAIVSSPEFIALFEAARMRLRDPDRKACIHGHPICAANAHVGDLRRTGKFYCNECNTRIQRGLTARADSATN